MKVLTKVIAVAAGLMFAGSASAITVTSTLDAMALEMALVNAGSGLSVNSISVSGQDDGNGLSAGTYTNAANTYGIGPGVVISSGDVADYGDGPNISVGRTTDFGGLNASPATASQELLLDPITMGPAPDGFNHFDVTQIDIEFDLAPGTDSVFFNVVWGSDEFNEFVGSDFIDAFGLYVNGINIADVAGNPVNIDHPDMAFTAGTELDGILTNVSGNPGPLVHTFSAVLGDGATGNTLTFIIADSGDSSRDSTAYISQLGGMPPPLPPSGGEVPEPVSAALSMVGLATLGAGLRRRRLT